MTFVSRLTSGDNFFDGQKSELIKFNLRENDYDPSGESPGLFLNKV